MIFPRQDDAAEPRPTPLYAAAASASTTNAWTSVNGWAVARVYTALAEEYEAASGAAALVDLGPLCRYTVRGREAAAFLARLTSCPVLELSVAESGRGLILDAEGFVVDYAELTRLSGDLFLLTTSMPADRRIRIAARGLDVETSNVGAMVASLGVVGPQAREAAAAAGLDVMEADASAQGRMRGVELAVRPINYGAAPGLEIIFPAEDALVIWERLRRKIALPAAGLDALDALRIEGGAPRPGVDFAGADNAASMRLARRPEEIGLPHLAPPNRAWFSGRLAMRAAGEARSRLAVLSVDCDQLPTGAPVHHRAEIIGAVTSTAFSPRLRRVLCFAELKAGTSTNGLEIALADGTRVEARHFETAESRLAAAFQENLRMATDRGRPPV